MEGTHYTNLFGSPLMAHKWEESGALNEDLRSRILAFSESNPGVSKTNVGGWHSESGLLEFCGAAGGELVRRIHAICNEATARLLREYGHKPQEFRWTLHAWANVNATGDFNRIHTHPGSTWSGTYYVDIGLDPSVAVNAAPLQIFDPCQGRANTFFPPLAPSSFTIRPEEGLMVLFPSYLPHMVLPQQGPRPRISVAFNLRREPFP